MKKCHVTIVVTVTFIIPVVETEIQETIVDATLEST